MGAEEAVQDLGALGGVDAALGGGVEDHAGAARGGGGPDLVGHAGIGQLEQQGGQAGDDDQIGDQSGRKIGSLARPIDPHAGVAELFEQLLAVLAGEDVDGAFSRTCG